MTKKESQDKYRAAHREELNAKARMRAAEKMKDPVFRERNRLYSKRYRQKAGFNEKRMELWKANAKRKKELAVEYLGGKCIICGYNKCLWALEFHHRNPEEKESGGPYALAPWRSFEKNKEELDKCDLVCCRCHREIHFEERCE